MSKNKLNATLMRGESTDVSHQTQYKHKTQSDYNSCTLLSFVLKQWFDIFGKYAHWLSCGELDKRIKHKDWLLVVASYSPYRH